tara:strand:- start:424 stop:1056 length:633 start_codon:yes stop_codon:yes gene_type:complete
LDEERHIIQIDEGCLQAAPRCSQESQIQDSKIAQRIVMRPVDPREINRCVVIGNGPSRKLTPLEQIKWPTFGCNQIYKDFQPDYLLAQDKAVLHQMQVDNVIQPVYVPQSSYRRHVTSSFTQLHDMREIKFPYIRMNSWLTGEQAIVLAAQLGFTRVDLLAFDGGNESIYREPQKIIQPHKERYQRTLSLIKEYYPNIKITVDQYFTSQG